MIACDPHGITDGVGGWLTSEGSNRVAIKVYNNNIRLAKIASDDEFVVVRVNSV